MAKAISLHIGLNSVDPIHYNGWNGMLTACEADAKDMLAIAKKQEFSDCVLLRTKEATVDAVSVAIQAAAKRLVKGDLFFLSYSGHGGQVPDKNLDEPDRFDETWVLYDRQLVDDELHQLYAKFKAGVRILVLSDSCHSGTVTRAVPPWEANSYAARVMPKPQADATYRKNRKLYDEIQRKTPNAENQVVKATVLLISGCQDNQLSMDGPRNGLFTGTMKKVWNNGKFKFGYKRFRDTIVAKMPATQTPNYLVVGAANQDFEDQSPFTI